MTTNGCDCPDCVPSNLRARVIKNGKQTLVELSIIDGSGHMLDSLAARSFELMRADAEEVGCEVIINSAWRSRHAQERLWKDYQRKLDVWEACKNKPDFKGAKPSPVALPGTSKHESGLAVDLDMVDDNGSTRPLLAWMKNNAARYGFANTVKSEPWHWEYVGKVDGA